MSKYVLAIDQGTTSSRAIVFDDQFRAVASAQKEFTQIYPHPGWVEHDPEEIWQSVLETCRDAIVAAKIDAADLDAIGITNQRETVVVWDRETSAPVTNAIVWQDRRTADMTKALHNDGLEILVSKKTGLLLDPYFSGSKLSWILKNIEDLPDPGRLCFGTIDSFLIWRFTGGKRHVTDATNASRTLLYDIHKGKWSATMMELFEIPDDIMPEVLDCADDFGVTDSKIFGAAVPITGVAGDQQAATVGQACFDTGMMKSTYGTGCFAVMNTGDTAVTSSNRLLTTIAYRLNGKVTYALEGSIFIAGAAVQWLRDGLGLIGSAAQSGDLAAAANESENIYLVPAFVGLGAPHWDPNCRGALYGITRGTGPKEIARATLESVAFQTLDLLDAMRKDYNVGEDMVLRVDGGMAASDWTMQRLADILHVPVERPALMETTALGAAYLAGLHVGMYGDQKDFAGRWNVSRRYEPSLDPITRDKMVAGWHDAVKRTLVT